MISQLINEAIFFYSFVGIISLLVGSFLNVVIYRLPVMMERGWQEGVTEYLNERNLHAVPIDSDRVQTDNAPSINVPADKVFNLAVPGSRCPHCDTAIRAWHNIPIISYLMLRGRCAYCQKPVSVRYPLIEFLTLVLSLLAAWQFGPSLQALLAVLVTWFLLAMSVIDIDHKLLPDSMTLPLMWIGLLCALIPVFADIESALIGAAAGYMTLWSIYQLFKLITGKEGMGFGDFKLLAALGALLGWQALPMVILLSSLVGAVVGLSLIVFAGRDRNIPIPFGPYLAAAGWIALLWGETLSNWYYGALI